MLNLCLKISVCVCLNLLKPTGDGIDLFQTYDMIW